MLLATGSRNLDAEGIDVGVFIGEPVETGLVARRVADLQMMTCASPAYLASHGVPRSPDDLTRHNCMVYIPPNGRLYDEWIFNKGADTRTVKVRGNYCSNEAYVLTEAALAGAGMNRMFHTLHDAYVASGSLVPVLTDWQSQGPRCT